MKAFTISRIRAGDQAKLERVFTTEDIDLFARVTGDRNPAHIQEEYAKTTMFGTRIVHGMLVASLFSALLGTELPGLGSIYTGQTLKFLRPVRPGDRITASVTVREVLHEKNRVVFDCVALNQDGEKVLVGEAVILPPADPDGLDKEGDSL